MKAMVLLEPRAPLKLMDVAIPTAREGQLLIQVGACALCRTDLHIIDGELNHPKLPLVPGHQIVGVVKEVGKGVTKFKVGQRIGVAWLAKSCGRCQYCLSGRENLCEDALYTGYQVDGGFAEYCVADANFCFLIPEGYSTIHAAPLLCAGLVGFRAYRMARDAKRIGFYGFGSSAHLLIQIALHEKKEVFVFTRKNDKTAQDFAKKLGAAWVGDSEQMPQALLDAALIFAPVGSLVPKALSAVDKGGVVICAGIHMSDIPSFPYSLLWGERILRSVANLTRKDGEEFLSLVSKVPIRTQVTPYPLEKVNDAIDDLRNGRLNGTAVITVSEQ